MSEFQLSETQWATMGALINALIPSLDPAVFAGTLPSSTGGDALAKEAEYASLAATNTRDLRPQVNGVLASLDPNSRNTLMFLINLLSYRASAATVTGTYRLITDMPREEVAKLVLGWQNSRLEMMRRAYNGILGLAIATYIQADPRVLQLVGYQEPHPFYSDVFPKLPQWEPKREQLPPAVSANVPIYLSADVVIVGSGSSCSITAHRLVKQGYSVLILEKGKYENLSEIGRTDEERDRHYELSARLTSNDSSITVLAGNTVGGGGAVNWSCSLKTPGPIREEFVKLGAPLYGTKEFSDATEYVWNQMHCFIAKDNHSFTNKLLLDGAEKLGYPAKATGQNTGEHTANTHFLEYGLRHGTDKGGYAEWLHYALSNGAKLIDEAEVVRIRHRNGRASGVDVVVKGTQHLVVNAKRVVCAAGSLHTPLLLKRSNFKNKHIGKGLKLHPVTVAYGVFPDQDVNKVDDAIMTAVCTQSDNLDGQYHGPKLEAMHHRPILAYKFLPWKSAEHYRRLLAQYKRLCTILVITRDKSEGKINYDSKYPMRPFIEYTTNEYDLWALKEGCLTSANLLYIEGAERLVMPLPSIPDFVSTKPKEQRSIWDADYREWYELVEKSTFRNYDISVGSAHQMASCRMSNAGPKHGAVDARGHLYECPNVHVVDTSVFPAASGVNPMITCMATAHVLAGYLCDDLDKTIKSARL